MKDHHTNPLPNYTDLKGTDANARTKEGDTPLILAASGDHLDTVKVLLKRCDIEAANENGHTAAHFAAAKGFLHLLLCLDEAGADLNALDKEGRNCLYLAGVGKPEEVLVYLMRRGVSAQCIYDKCQDVVESNKENM